MKTPIRHIVISSGMHYGFSFYGALKWLSQHGKYDIADIQSIYATSAGSVVATILTLKYDWDVLDTYIVERPWHTLLSVNLAFFVKCAANTGALTMHFFKAIFTPLFAIKDIPIDITLLDFFKITHIDLHFFTVRFSDFTSVDLSHATHPTWTVIEAIYASSCAPVLFTPLAKNGDLYIDGALLADFPINQCINSHYLPKIDEILGINKSVCLDIAGAISLNNYIPTLLNKMVCRLNPVSAILPTICIPPLPVAADSALVSILCSKTARKKMIDHGFNHVAAVAALL